ncbi:MAG: SMI1/KNR4 family protein [Isosphaeraceae bacterium]
MWKKLLQRLTEECVFAPPASASQITAAERSLGVNLPDSLRDLLSETNGVPGEYGLGLIWPWEQIIADNLAFRENEGFRELYMPFTHLLFFADAGNGDQFAFSIHADGVIHRPDVFAWNHEDDSRNWVAPSLEHYLDWWLTGKFTL